MNLVRSIEIWGWNFRLEFLVFVQPKHTVSIFFCSCFRAHLTYLEFFRLSKWKTSETTLDVIHLFCCSKKPWSLSINSGLQHTHVGSIHCDSRANSENAFPYESKTYKYTLMYTFCCHWASFKSHRTHTGFPSAVVRSRLKSYVHEKTVTGMKRGYTHTHTYMSARALSHT